MSQSNTLAPKVFKAKYFSKCDFVEASRRSSSNFVWRCLWEAKHVIKERAKRAIGDGSNFRVFEEI